LVGECSPGGGERFGILEDAMHIFIQKHIPAAAILIKPYRSFTSGPR
jgi:hypothetical protein